jgi:hypothetical protein
MKHLKAGRPIPDTFSRSRIGEPEKKALLLSISNAKRKMPMMKTIKSCCIKTIS